MCTAVMISEYILLHMVIFVMTTTPDDMSTTVGLGIVSCVEHETYNNFYLFLFFYLFNIFYVVFVLFLNIYLILFFYIFNLLKKNFLNFYY